MGNLLKTDLTTLTIHTLYNMARKTNKTAKRKFAPAHGDTMLRKFRKTILLNEKELDAINRYCEKYKISSRSAFIRTAVMAHIMSDMDQNYPKLF